MYRPKSMMQRAALGRMAKIGAIYDVRTESFTGDTLFGSRLEDDTIDSMDLGNTSIELVMKDNILEKFKKLDVEGELQVSLMSGLVKPSGSGAYLSEDKKSARTQSISLIYKLKTVNEEIAIRQNKDKIDMDILTPSSNQALDGTHVVIGIDWGATCSVTCKYENTEDEDALKVRGALGAELEKIKVLINTKISTNMALDNQKKDSQKNFTFTCKADVSTPNSDLPVTFEGAVQLARNLPDLVKNTNKGKGVPVTFMLMPLEVIAKMCKLQTNLHIQYRAIDDEIVTKCGQVLERITEMRQTLYDVHTDLHTCEDYVPEESLVRIDDTFEKFIVNESGYKGRLQDIVKKVRSGNEDASSLASYIGEGMSVNFPLSRCKEQILEFQKDLNNVQCIKLWRSIGIVCMGRKDQFIVNDKRNVYVFYKTCDEDGTNSRDKNQRFFLRLQKTHVQDNNYKFVVVDQKVRKDLWPTGKVASSVHKFVKGRLTSEDLYATEGQDEDLCLIKIADPVYKQIRPSNRANTKLRCPNALTGKGECSGSPVTWMCSTCKQVVEYGIDTKRLYCKCGESVPRKSLFRCNEMNHGMDYIKYPKGILNEELSRLRAMEEKNVLVLGETGVGKSTWINAFMSYLYYEDMQDAINAKDRKTLIPSSFTFTEQGEEKNILIGEADANENIEPGHSSTKQPRPYIFDIGDLRIRLIDTPGIGDCNGIEQDKKNFDNILSYLTYFDEIHAVCILLKPNNARLTAMFRFCIQELLSHLHTSAKDNIVFCFTNARGTFFKPGDTLSALNRELRNREVGIQATKHNYFCFDNEPLRLLACIHNGVKFTQEDIDTYAKSWDESFCETKRLFKHINTLPPHKVKNTLSMNEARRVIVAMSKPLAEVATTIEHNVQQGKDYKEKIDKHGLQLEDLQKTLMFPGFNLDIVLLDHPRTVCADSRCVKYVRVGKEKVQNIVYDQICHPHCTLSGIKTETTNDFRLKFCWCINLLGTKCHQCDHDYKVHMHITYDTKIVETQFLSEEVQAEIKENNSLKESKEKAKAAIDTKNKELIQEKETIMKASAKFGSYLKEKAIIPYNDAVEEYLDMSIELERKKEAAVRNDTFLSTMEDMRKQYEQERKILDKAIGRNSAENLNSPEEVMKLQNELFRLKHMGKTLEDLFKGISIVNSANNIAFEEKIVPLSPNNKKTKTLMERFLQSISEVDMTILLPAPYYIGSIPYV